MKNKLMFLFIFIFALSFGMYSVSARECKYDYEGKDITLNFTKADEGESFNVELTVENESKYDRIFNFVDGSLIKDDDTCYGSLNVCTLTVSALKLGTPLAAGLKPKEKYLGIFGSSLDTLTIDDAYANNFDANDIGFWERSFFTGRAVDCSTADYSGEKLEEKNMVYFCTKFNELFSKIKSSYLEYKDCGEITGSNSQKSRAAKCRAKALSDVTKHTDTLRNTCNNIMQNQNYNATDGCISTCLNAVKSIDVLKKDYIGLENFNNDCGFSDRLIVWIANIIRWIKYIIPIAVVILGIIDFIKAIGSDKDDEMKKAQGRFIKRLIAAALIFIVPFILEFILDKLGFSYNGCGIIDL